MNNPIKPSFKTEIFSLLIILITIGLSIYFYGHLPDKIPVHWNFAGEVNRMGSSTSVIFAVPAFLIFFYIMFLFLPLLDPKKERYEEFKKVYHTFKNIILLLFFLLYLATGLNGLGHNININLFVPIAIGVLFITLGNYLGKVKSNWFVGIKTPWTLSSENVWNKTHRLGGKTFIIGGTLLILEPFSPLGWKLPIFIIAILLSAVLPIIYSYIIYKKENNKS
ncbi:SdpI family protein [bacterium]|nr:SdpI family protein [bacterium]